MRFLALVVLACLCLVLLPACGGSGEAVEPSEPVFLRLETRLDTSPAGSTDSAFPWIACDASRVYVVWQDDRNGFSDIYLNRSEDGGRTWLAGDVRLDTDVAGSARSALPVVCCDGPNVYVAWEDDRNGQADVYVNVSSDGGETWLTSDRRVDTDPPGFSASRDVHLACDGTRVQVVWSDARTGNWNVRMNASQDGGSTWFSSDRRVDTAPPGVGEALFPRVASSGAGVYVAWEEDRNGVWDVFFNRSQDGGETWDGSDQRVDTASPNTGASLGPRICCDGSLVYVVWSDTRSGLEQVRFNGSSDGGASWFPNDRRLDTDLVFDGASRNPEIACVGSTVHVAWDDDRFGTRDVRVSRSTDAGATWLLDDVRVDTDPTGSADSRRPRICADGAFVYVTWVDDRAGTDAIRLTLSQDAGTSWLAEDLRVDRSPAGVSFASTPRLCCEGDRVWVTWRDTRFGAGDIYVNGGEVP